MKLMLNCRFLAMVAVLALTALSCAAQEAAEEAPMDGLLSVDRAWDYRPYRVRVWICTDGSPEVNANFDRMVSGLQRRAQLADPSAWELLISRAPNPWAFRLPGIIENPEGHREFSELPELKHDDKLMVVCLKTTGGLIHCSVREFDILTQQWGALGRRDVAQWTQLDGSVYDLVATAFMPLARVDRVDVNNNVFMQARAVNLCRRAEENEEGEWELVDNSGSPVWVRDDDMFLPIIRRVGRDGKLDKLAPVEFTFLTINSVDGADVEATVQSSTRAPLAGRTSNRAQKLALVIRPPAENTTLTLVSRNDENKALEGFEVYSRRIGAEKEEASEYLGQTNWRGQISIPPSENGLRVIFIKRGSRALKKIPIMPGLYDQLKTTLPNDEARLYAEGIIKGLRSEVLNLVAQRAVYEEQIEIRLNRNDIEGAKDMLGKYRTLPTLDQLRSRMTDDKSRLKAQASDKREVDYIERMFSTLRQIIAENVGTSKAPELLKRIQDATPKN